MTTPNDFPAAGGAKAQKESGMNAAAWLPKRLAQAFRRHVGAEYGAASRFIVEAIEERLRREGAFDDKQADHAAAVLKGVPAEALPVLVEFAEILATRGPAAVKGVLDELKGQALEEAVSQ